MTEEKRYPFAQIKPIADRAVLILEPHCEIIHIAGSLRRKEHTAKDIEILCLPKKEIKNSDLFGNGEWIIARDFIEALATITATTVKGFIDGRYMQIILKAGYVLDLFLPSPNDYYRQLAIRTGSAEYAHNVIAAAWKRNGWCGSDHGLRRISDCIPKKDTTGKTIGWRCIRTDGELPPAWKSEPEFFQWLGLIWVPPEIRDIKKTINESQ
jgi:DNA polymerase/3'-5' exonuclease PolX